MSLRLGGYAAVGGAILFFIGLVVGSGTVGDPGLGTIYLVALLLGTALLLVALVGLSAFQARSHPRLVWAAFAIPAVGAVASLIGFGLNASLGEQPVIGELSGWYVWMLGTVALLLGSGLFGLATWRTRTLSRIGAALLVLAAVIALPVLATQAGGGPLGGPAGILITITLFAAGWAALGLSAIQSDRSGAMSRGAATL